MADVAFSYTDATTRLRFRGDLGLAFNIVREAGANVISVMEDIRTGLSDLADGPVADAGLQMRQVYDETIYINGAISLMTQNI